MPSFSTAAVPPIADDTVCEALRTYISPEKAVSAPPWHDAGPAILATLAYEAGYHEIGSRALSVWLKGLLRGTTYVGIVGGMAGFYSGVQFATRMCPRLLPLANRLQDALIRMSVESRWRSSNVAWEDYDLVTGAAGLVLGLTTNRNCQAASVRPAAQHLAYLCQDKKLSRLRIGSYRNDKQRGWNFGFINTGLAHGVTGVAAALRAASEVSDDIGQQLAPALRRVSYWLVSESFVDERGLRTWQAAGREGSDEPRGAGHRQAWCYGTPGIAWTLWEASRVLGDENLQGFAERAMQSFCEVFDIEYYLKLDPLCDALPLCHGAAGTLAIADAFHRLAGLPEAESLCNCLNQYLTDHDDDIRDLGRHDMSLLNGASGILCVQLVTRGAQRDWLPMIALR